MDLRSLSPRDRRVVAVLAVLACVTLGLAAGRFTPDGGERLGIAGFIGRFHPLLLHAPVTLLPLALVMEFFSLRWRPNWKDAAGFVMALAVISTLGATAAGLMLGYAGGFEGDAVRRHLIGGVATSVLAVLAWILLARDAGNLRKLGVALLVVAQGVLVWTAHIGGGLTHGDDYLVAGLPPEWRERLGFVPVKNISPTAGIPTDSVFERDIRPVFTTACVDCHKEGKIKGGLRLDSLAGLVRGGTTGAAVVPGKPDASLLLQRILLSASHEKSMPPAPRKRLDPAQVAKLREWIVGAKLVVATPEHQEKADDEGVNNYYGEPVLPPVGDAPDFRRFASAIESYTTATGAALIPVSARSGDGLLLRTQAIRPTFDDAALAGLGAIAPLVTDADLAHTRITDAGLAKALPGFSRVKRLDLSGLPVGPAALKAVAALPALESLVLTGAPIDDSGLAALGAAKRLRRLFIAGTGATPAGISALARALPRCVMESKSPVITTVDAADPRAGKPAGEPHPASIPTASGK